MPHSLIIVAGSQEVAWQAFDKHMPFSTPRIMLTDTYYDEKIELIRAAETIPRLEAVRLDTIASRRGDMEKIVREVRWELNLRGYRNVKIFVSGGLNDKQIAVLSKAGADAFGVGTFVSGAPTIDFAMDIIEKNGVPCAKRGKMGGKKEVYNCPGCGLHLLAPAKVRTAPRCEKCGSAMQPMLKKFVSKGKVLEYPETRKSRENLLENLKHLETMCN